MLRSAHKYLDRMKLKKGESLLLITEPPTDRRVTEALFDAALQLKANPVVIMAPYRGEHNVDPLLPVANAMKSVDAAITLIPYNSADFYTKAFLEMLQAGTRMLGFLNANAEMMVNLIYEHDFTVTDQICEVLENVISRASKIHVTCPRGTDISATLGGRPVQTNPGKIALSGDEGYIPPGVVGQAPIEESWNGKAVFNAFAYPVGVLTEPIEVEIKDGRLVKISGGRQADEWRQWFENRNDSEIYRVAHYGFGTNPSLKRLSGLKFLDERMYGIFDIGFGTNDIPCFGGDVRANGHTDGLMTDATVYYDGECVFKDGAFIHPDLAPLL